VGVVGCTAALAGTASEYWRNADYNLTRTIVLTILGFAFGVIFFDVGVVLLLLLPPLLLRRSPKLSCMRCVFSCVASD
jgi:hypothetical protein